MRYVRPLFIVLLRGKYMWHILGWCVRSSATFWMVRGFSFPSGELAFLPIFGWFALSLPFGDPLSLLLRVVLLTLSVTWDCLPSLSGWCCLPFLLFRENVHLRNQILTDLKSPKLACESTKKDSQFTKVIGTGSDENVTGRILPRG